jgi:hypothetical protein
MSVWTTLSESDTAEVDIVPGPRARPGSPLAALPEAGSGLRMVDEPVEPPAVAGRRALREARRKRQITAVVWVVVIAVLLAASIMIVGVARDRPVTPSSLGNAASSSLGWSTPSL